MEVIEGFTFEPINDEHTEEIIKNSFAKNASYANTIIHPSECAMSDKYKKYIKRILDFEVYSDDTWVITFPKCGTTWTQEMVWLLKNNLDYEKAKSCPLRTRFPFMELEGIMCKIADDLVYPPTVDLAANTPRPRCIKSHLPLELLPRALWTVKPKIVYVARDPRDAMISYYHHHRLWNGYDGKLEDFAEVFLADKVVYAPFWKHVLNFYNIQDKSHILFNTYEEMKKDLKGVIQKTAKFLNVELNDEDLERLKNHLSFNNMKDNESVNYMDLGKDIKKGMKKENDDNLNFIRKGESGGWKKVLSNDILDKFDKWNERYLKGTQWSKYPWS